MSTAALSVENRVDALMADLTRTNGLTASSFTRTLNLLGEPMSTTKFSQALARNRPFSNDEGIAVLTLLRELVDLRESYTPLPISFKQPEPIAALIAEQRRLKREAPVPQIFSVVVNNGRNFFVEKDATGDCIFSLAAAFAATMSKPVANRVAAALAALGYDAEVTPNCLKGLNGLHTTFEKLMGLPDAPVSTASIAADYEPQ